jgi:hypothetical protein
VNPTCTQTQCITQHPTQHPKPNNQNQTKLINQTQKVVVLYIDEETSIRRQLTRARVASAHNRRVLDAGAGTFHEERATDLDVEKCRKR